VSWVLAESESEELLLEEEEEDGDDDEEEEEELPMLITFLLFLALSGGTSEGVARDAANIDG
jgi:hypothetical protein